MQENYDASMRTTGGGELELDDRPYDKEMRRDHKKENAVSQNLSLQTVPCGEVWNGLL